MVYLKMAHLGRVTHCFQALLFLCKLVFFNYNFHKNTRSRPKRFVSKKGQPRPHTQLKVIRLLTETLKNDLFLRLYYSVHYILPPRNSSYCYFDTACKICFSFANLRNTPLALSLFTRLLFYLT